MPSERRARRDLAHLRLVPTSGALLLPIALAHCGGAAMSAGSAGDAGKAADATVEDGAADGAPETSTSLCQNAWQCAEGGSCVPATTVSGKVFDPAGSNALPNVVLFVPADPSSLPPIAPGSPSCAPSETITNYRTATVSAVDGTFKLVDVPTGHVPVTVQAGKWRRTVWIDVTTACGDNPVADGVLRLPANRSEGDMPQIALLTGGEDNMGCFLRGVGVDEREFGPPGSGTRVDVYQGVGGAALSSGSAGDCTGAACPLWSSHASLAAYDVILLGCEGAANLQTKPATAMQAMHDWLGSGGRLLGVHAEDVWFSQGPADFQAAASWIDGGASGAPGPFVVNPQSAQAQDLSVWALANGVVADGGVRLAPADVATSVSSVGSGSIAWIYDESTAAIVDGSAFPGNAKALTVGVPAVDAGGEAAEAVCGKAVLTDIHPGGTAVASPVPSACPAGTLSAEEKVLEYLLFDAIVFFGTPPCNCPPPPPPPPPDGG